MWRSERKIVRRLFLHVSFVCVLCWLLVEWAAEINEVMIAKKYHLLKTIWSLAPALCVYMHVEVHGCANDENKKERTNEREKKNANKIVCDVNRLKHNEIIKMNHFIG